MQVPPPPGTGVTGLRYQRPGAGAFSGHPNAHASLILTEQHAASLEFRTSWYFERSIIYHTYRVIHPDLPMDMVLMAPRVYSIPWMLQGAFEGSIGRSPTLSAVPRATGDPRFMSPRCQRWSNGFSLGADDHMVVGVGRVTSHQKDYIYPDTAWDWTSYSTLTPLMTECR